MKKLLLIFSIIFMISGCGGGDYTHYSASMKSTNQSNALIASSYFENKNKTDQEIIKHLAATSNETAIVLYGIITNQNNEKIILALRASKLEAPTTTTDVWNNFLSSTVPTIAKWGFGYLLGSEVVDGLSGAGAITLAGTGNTNYLNSMNKGSLNSMKDGSMTNSLDESFKVDISLNEAIESGEIVEVAE